MIDRAMQARFLLACLLTLGAGCSANHATDPSESFPVSSSNTVQDAVSPFNLHKSNIAYNYLVTSAAFPHSLATGSDHNVWFTEDGYHRIGVVTQTGTFTDYAIPSGAFGQFIAAGDPGTLWFTENGGTNIGKITTAGAITEFTVGPNTVPYGITKGPDGNMWFTDINASMVGKITPGGVITEYPTPSTNAAPTGIATGPDGNLWFVEKLTNRVGKVDPTTGAVTEFPASPDGDVPSNIAAGPDGNLYVSSGHGIWRVTTAGVVTEYVSTQMLWSFVIVGPNGQMWLASDSSYTQEFDPRTQTFSPPVKLNNNTRGLTLGADGDVWISNSAVKSSIMVYEEKITTIGIRLNGELSFTDPNYGFELGYAVGTTSHQTQTISLGMGESAVFQNVDTEPHSAAFVGNATVNSAPWPGLFNGSTTQSPAGTAIGTTGWATGSLLPSTKSPVYETGLPGFYMIGCQYHYNPDKMRTVIVVH